MFISHMDISLSLRLLPLSLKSINTYPYPQMRKQNKTKQKTDFPEQEGVLPADDLWT